jgi:hypothetical protein
MAKDHGSPFRLQQLVFRFRPPRRHQLGQIAQRHQRHRFELAFGASNKGLAWKNHIVVVNAA